MCGLNLEYVDDIQSQEPHMFASSNTVTWVVITDTNDCRIYQYSNGNQSLLLIKEIKHPENKLRDIELTSDKPGHYKSGMSGRGAFSQRTDPKEILIDDFAREIARELDHGRTVNAYSGIVLFALPHMHGLIKQHMNPHVRTLITHAVEKDVMKISTKELLDLI